MFFHPLNGEIKEDRKYLKFPFYEIQLGVGLLFQVLGGLFMADVSRFHISILNTNDTACENYRFPYLGLVLDHRTFFLTFRVDHASYDIGKASSWMMVFGERLWCLPVVIRLKEDDGLHYKVNYPNDVVDI